MALNPKTCVAVRNAALNALTTEVGASGKMIWYDGTQPTDPDTALGSNNVIVTLTCSATFAAGASAGSMTVNSITGANASATGNPTTWYSFTTSASVRKHDGSIGTSGANLNLNSVTVGSGSACACSSFTLTMAA
jgi:hypothetical protein